MTKFNKFSKPKPGPSPARKNFHGKKKKKNFKPSAPRAPKPLDYEETGMEAMYLKSLVDTETPIVVVLNSGEQVRGTVRYYDREIFSIGPSDGSPKLFLRKSSVRYLYEEGS